MEVTELTTDGIAQVIADMRHIASMDRLAAEDMTDPAQRTVTLSNAVLTEHWADRLEKLIQL